MDNRLLSFPRQLTYASFILRLAPTSSTPPSSNSNLPTSADHRSAHGQKLPLLAFWTPRHLLKKIWRASDLKISKKSLISLSESTSPNELNFRFTSTPPRERKTSYPRTDWKTS